MTTDKVNTMLHYDDVVIGHPSLLPSSTSDPRYKASVLPLEDNPELAELLLESTDYLINPIGDMTSMKRPASAQSSTASSNSEKMAAGRHDDDDIAAIAKQISDHAEAIYQTWKSRGLGPAELRNICQPPSAAAQTFAPVLTPTSPKPFPTDPGPPSPSFKTASVGMLNPSQLEYLVSSFVEEDKARIAANYNKHQPSVSLIKSQVQKFDQQAASSGRNSPLLQKVTPPPVKKQSTPAYLPNDQPENGLTTWPLKNHLGPRSAKGPLSPMESIPPAVVTHLGAPAHKIEPIQVIHYQEVTPDSSLSGGPSKFATLPAKKKNSATFLEEVAREEERLINALKTGCVIENLEHKMQLQSPSLANMQNKSGRASPKIPDDKISGLSRIDYAKIRFQNAQENPLTRQRMENNRELDPMLSLNNQHAAVLEAKSRFETQTNGEHWLPTSKVDGPALQGSVPLGRSRIKMGRKSRGDLEGAVPHPELTIQQKQHIRERGSAAAAAASAAGPTALGTNPIRPFLTRGSVAERVLIFEKCPPSEVLNPLMEKRKAPPVITTWRSGNEVQNKTQEALAFAEQTSQVLTYSCRDRGDITTRGSPNSSQHTLRSHHAPIPRFHFPRGRPPPQHEHEAARHAVIALFKTFPGERATRDNFADIAKACGFPMYWKMPLYLACGGEATGGVVLLQTFLDLWHKICSGGNDEASRMVWLMTRGQRLWLAPEDLAPMVQDVVDTHPGLSFLKEATEFHSRYVHTVIARIFYCANRSWSGRLTIPEIKKSHLLQAVRQLEATSDINQVTQFFSYEHFYVIYCKFWELDRDHDLFIDRNDLARHNDHALSTRMIDRIFSGAVTRGRRTAKKGDERMSYTEFVWFLLSEEDKTHSTAVEYWFRCMDLDGDGYLSMYELEYFYEEQLQRMEAIGMDTLPFEDCLCQMLDMIRPEVSGKISLRDLKRCKLSPLFFDTFFNLEKFLDHEQRDPFNTQPRESAPDGTEMSDWDRFAAEEYELLVAEESGPDAPDDLMMYSDDLSEDDDDEDILSPNLDRLDELAEHQQQLNRSLPKDEDAWGDLSNLSALDGDEDSGDYAGDSDDYSF
ncbi:uncharacterized protein LOC132204029 isoform X3 [Neocloeon triangulifer]|uniref:uncharacterized protein LOC132204029 isoform X3 n=1 Tax=Neocloeon triangulifer TaxID=2078957 RepID=UPI00286F682B|nr:uncharacterized protein LOC132204029 isoform X3 [Neocloeon triangulifer]